MTSSGPSEPRHRRPDGPEPSATYPRDDRSAPEAIDPSPSVPARDAPFRPAAPTERSAPTEQWSTDGSYADEPYAPRHAPHGTRSPYDPSDASHAGPYGADPYRTSAPHGGRPEDGRHPGGYDDYGHAAGRPYGRDAPYSYDDRYSYDAPYRGATGGLDEEADGGWSMSEPHPAGVRYPRRAPVHGSPPPPEYSAPAPAPTPTHAPAPAPAPIDGPAAQVAGAGATGTPTGRAGRRTRRKGPELVTHHGHGHSHSHGHGPIPIGPVAARVVIGLLTVIGIASLVGLVVLWPDRVSVDVPTPFQSADGSAVQSVNGTVLEQNPGLCPSPSAGRVFSDAPLAAPAGGYECPSFVVSIDSGPNAGNRTLLEVSPGPGQPDLQPGDKIRLVRGIDTSGSAIYGFDDFQRTGSLLLVVAIFVIVIVVVAGLRGLRALIGLTLAFGVIVVFILPALLDDKPPVPVALVGGSLILYAVLYLAHGVNLRTSAALLGTLTSMVVAAIGSVMVIDGTGVTGLSEEQNTNIQTYLEHVSIIGLLLAGFIIGSLGVLNDVTITQASATFELAAANPDASRLDLFRGAMRVGRDHIASTVYTLMLAYAGGALPLLLLLSVAGRPLGDLLTGDAIATEIARSAVGGIALTLSVPLTTGIAAMLARPPGRAAGRHAARH